MAEPFPSVGMITSFAGAAENPLSEGGAWATYGSPPDRYPLQKMAPGSVTPTTEFFVNGMYYTRQTFLPTCEVFACVEGGGLGAANESWRVVFWLGHPDSATGYLSGFGGGIGEEYFVRKYNGGSFDNWTTLGTLDTTNPVKLGLRITASAVEQWAEFGGTWSLIQSFGDTTYRGAFYAAIEMEEQGSVGNVGMGCFGAGVKNRQHIYRVLRA
jgi:hypothetical protein